MKRILVNITNHELTKEQQQHWYKVIEMPTDVKKLWGNIPPEMSFNEVEKYLEPLCEWLKIEEEKSIREDYVLEIVVAGDLSATLILLKKANSLGLSCYQATTQRVSKEVTLPDGSVKKTNVFKHVRWRKIKI